MTDLSKYMIPLTPAEEGIFSFIKNKFNKKSKSDDDDVHELSEEAKKEAPAVARFAKSQVSVLSKNRSLWEEVAKDFGESVRPIDLSPFVSYDPEEVCMYIDNENATDRVIEASKIDIHDKDFTLSNIRGMMMQLFINLFSNIQSALPFKNFKYIRKLDLECDSGIRSINVDFK